MRAIAVEMRTIETERHRFVELIERHQGILHRFCSVYAAHVHDRQDLFQEMVLQLWHAWAAFRGQSSLTTWIYRVALNTALLQKRKASRRPDLSRGGEAEIAAVSVAASVPNDGVELL